MLCASSVVDGLFATISGLAVTEDTASGLTDDTASWLASGDSLRTADNDVAPVDYAGTLDGAGAMLPLAASVLICAISVVHATEPTGITSVVSNRL